MKQKILTSALFLLSTVLLYSQQNSTVTSNDTVEYLTPQEYAMMIDRDDRFLFRASLISVGAEWEFMNNFSILAQGGLIEDLYESEFVRAELRYYLPLKNFSKSNLNGPYISFGAKAYSRFQPIVFRDFTIPDFNARVFSLNFGLLRRFLGNGLADLSLSFGHLSYRTQEFWNGTSFEEREFSSYLIESRVAVGLGIALNNNREIDYDRLCPVVKCHETEKFLVKVNASGVLRLEFEEFYTRLDAVPSVAVEQKFGNLPFSAQFKSTLDYTGWFANENEPRGDVEYSEIKLDLETRYYYNLNSRIRNGRTGNSLSANYFALGLTDRSVREKDSRRTRYFDYQGFYATAGVQRTYGKRLYFDLYLGFASLGVFDDSQYSEVEFMGGANVGIKF